MQNATVQKQEKQIYFFEHQDEIEWSTMRGKLPQGQKGLIESQRLYPWYRKETKKNQGQAFLLVWAAGQKVVM